MSAVFRVFSIGAGYHDEIRKLKRGGDTIKIRSFLFEGVDLPRGHTPKTMDYEYVEKIFSLVIFLIYFGFFIFM